MPLYKTGLFSIAFLVMMFCFGDPLFRADELGHDQKKKEIYEVIFPAPEKPQPGQLVMAAEWRIWIPETVKILRGVVIHQHGCGEGSCNSGRTGAFDLHWQALARKYDCALLAVSYRQEKHPCQLWCDPRNGSAQSLLNALDYFAQKSGHLELTVVPWALWGHSGGGHWCGSMVQLYPKRVMAAWLRSGHPDCVGQTFDSLPVNSDVLQVPVLLNLGAKETNMRGVWDNGWIYFQKFRSQKAKIGLMIDPNTHHETGNSRYPAIRFLDLCMEQRIPAVPGTSVLRPMKTGFVLSGSELGAQDRQEFIKDGIWLPTESFVNVWKQYSKDNTFEDTTPPPAPENVIIDASGLMKWKCRADLESGLQTFEIRRNGQKIAALPTGKTVHARPLFQGMSYSDTPDASLPKMEFIIKNYLSDDGYVYSVGAVNTAGLYSEFTQADQVKEKK